jgi:hypothetical protein
MFLMLRRQAALRLRASLTVCNCKQWIAENSYAQLHWIRCHAAGASRSVPETHGEQPQ